jgi:hypothetical protein
VRIFAAEIFVPEIVVGVELNEGDGAVFFGYGAEDGETDGMVTADANTASACLENRSNSLLDALEGVFDGERVDGEIAEIGDAIFGEGIYVEDRIPRTDDCGLDADVARTEAWAGAIGGAAVERDADEGEVEFFGLRDVRKAHEGGDAGEAGVPECIERLRMGQVKDATGFGHGRILVLRRDGSQCKGIAGMIYLSACGSFQQLPYNPATSLDNRHPQKKQECGRLVHTPALTYLLLLTAGTRGAAVSGRATVRLRRPCSRYSKRDNNQQQHSF